MFTKFSLVRVLIALVVMLTVGLSSFCMGLTNTSPESLLSIDVGTPTPTPTQTVNTWLPNNCEVLFAKVQLGEIESDEDHPASWSGSKMHEVWRIYVFGSQIVPVDNIDLYDRWDNEIQDVVYDAKPEDVPSDAWTAWFYNQFGPLGGWDEPGEEPMIDGFCHEVEGQIDWAEKDELTLLGSFNFRYPTDQGVTEWSDFDFNVDFYAGHELTTQDREILDFQLFGLHRGTAWTGTGFIGPSSSSHGRFTFDQIGNLVWKFTWVNPNYDLTIDTGFGLPVGREVVIVTNFSTGKTKIQRMVFQTLGRKKFGITPIQQPDYILP